MEPTDDRAALVGDGTVTVQEAAKFLGLCENTVYNLIQAGELPSTKIRRRRLIPRKALVDLAAAGLPEK